MTVDNHPNITFALSVWAVLGPLVGLLIGNFLQSRSQLKQWRRDAGKQEYRELLSTLARCHALIGRLTSKFGNETKEDDENLAVAHADALNVIRDRVFIADDVAQMDLLNKWLRLTLNYHKSHDVGAFRTEFEAVSALIVQTSKKHL